MATTLPSFLSGLQAFIGNAIKQVESEAVAALPVVEQAAEVAALPALSAIPGFGVLAPALKPIVDSLLALLNHTIANHATAAQAAPMAATVPGLNNLAQQISAAAQAAAKT